MRKRTRPQKILERFEAHLKDAAPGFRCCAAGKGQGRRKRAVRVTHRVGKGADGEAMGLMERRLGEVDGGIRAFYEVHDGARLYIDTEWMEWERGQFKAVGIEFFAVHDWDKYTEKLLRGVQAMGWEEVPRWVLEGVVIGQIPHSGNYFVLRVEGKDAGQVYYADHEDPSGRVMAGNFEALLGKIVEDPAKFLLECGCYTRYADGKTETQWIPEKYVAG